MRKKIRAFVAIELPGEILQAIRELQDEMKSEKLDLRWVEPGNIHLTLKFLGEMDPKDLEPVCHVVKNTAGRVPAFDLVAKGIGAFPGLNRPRVVWAGISGKTESLGKLADFLDQELEALGFERESRPFKGHLTLARARGAVDPVRMTRAAGRLMTFQPPVFSVHDLILFQSRLMPEGPVYEKLFSAFLGE